MKASTPRFIHTPGKAVWIAAAMLDFPDRGVPFSTTIRPGADSVSPMGRGYPVRSIDRSAAGARGPGRGRRGWSASLDQEQPATKGTLFAGRSAGRPAGRA